MSENAIDAVKGTPEPAAKAEAPSREESQAREEGESRQEADGQAEDGSHQQEGRSDRADEARQRRHTRGDHECHWLAAAHRTRLRQHPRQQGRREDRVV